ncbi:transposase [Streptomyces sp. NPDC057910]|uniref:transposase n=1 Tax=Streptomyces sp. NPDC057910 TaxID=3346278 RepID=UPI0036E12F2D
MRSAGGHSHAGPGGQEPHCGATEKVTGIVERLVPEELWELFQRVVPETPSRPRGGGRRRRGGREVLTAIVFVVTTGCTCQQLPSASFGPSGATAHQRFRSGAGVRLAPRLVLDELGARGELRLVPMRDRLSACSEACAEDRSGCCLRGQKRALLVAGPGCMKTVVAVM